MAERPRQRKDGPGRGAKDGPAGGESGIEDEVVRIYRCAAVVKGGRRFSFSALVVVGDRQGRVGIGYGKAKEVPSAVEKGKQIATRSMQKIKLKGVTLPHRVVGRFGASMVVIPNACHSPHVEQPEAFVKHFLEFAEFAPQ